METAHPTPDDTHRVDRRRLALEEAPVLRRCLERILARDFGMQPSTIVRIQRTRFPYIGSYDCETVMVQLAGDVERTFFMKDYGCSQQSKDDPMQRRERELKVYRDLLAHTGLGTPVYYGSVWDESEGRYWLILEFVQGVVVKDCNREHGTMAAAWLARMQGYFTRHPNLLQTCDYLIRHDAEYFRTKAALALRDAREIAPRAADRLAAVVERYEPIVNVMAAQPTTLVHGGYIPWHIVIDRTCQPVRVCPVDWELAALGATLYDLAFFSDGAESHTRALLCDAYRTAAVEHDVSVSDPADMRYVVDCVRLHRVMDWLSRSVEKQFSDQKLTRLVDMAEERIAPL